MKNLKDIREDSTRDPRGMSKQSLSRIANTPGHPLSSTAKDELARRNVQQEGGMKRIVTTQSNKADRMAAGGKKGLETFKKRPAATEKYDEPQSQAKSMMSPLQKLRLDKEKADRDKEGKLKHKSVTSEAVNEAATPAMKKAADELNSYAKKSGGIDKADFMKAAKMLSSGKAGMALIKFVDGQDTEVYEKIIRVMAKHMGKRTVEKMFKVNIREEVKELDEAGPRHTMTTMNKRFGGTVDSKKFDAYKKHMKKHSLDEPTVRMAHQKPDHPESKSMMKNPKYVQALSLYKAAQKNESTDLSKLRSMIEKNGKNEQSADKLYNYWNKAYDDVSDPEGKDPSKLKKRRSFMKKAAAQHNVKMGWKKPTGVKKDASGASKSAAALAKHLAKKDMQQ